MTINLYSSFKPILCSARNVTIFSMVGILSFLLSTTTCFGQSKTELSSIKDIRQSIKAYRSEYYAVLPFWESPYLPFAGADAITSEHAATRIHLQLDYDSLGRIIASHVKIGSAYKEFEGRFGHLYINAPLTLVAYNDNQETHSFFDRFGNQIKVQDDVYKKVYYKDDLNRNIRLSFFDEDDNTVNDVFGVQEYTWTHLPDGSVIEERFDSDGKLVPLRRDFQLLRTKMIFGSSGFFGLLINVDSVFNTLAGPNQAAAFRYYYDTKNRFKRWEVFDQYWNSAIGPSNTAGEYNLHARHDLLDIVFFNPQGEPALHWSGAERWHLEVDDYGNITTLSFQKNDGTLMNGSRGYAVASYIWSEDGRFLQSQSFFDSSGEPILHGDLGVHEILYLRKENGVIEEIKHLDTSQELKNRRDTGVARIVYEYDANWLLKETHDFSAKESNL